MPLQVPAAVHALVQGYCILVDQVAKVVPTISVSTARPFAADDVLHICTQGVMLNASPLRLATKPSLWVSKVTTELYCRGVTVGHLLVDHVAVVVPIVSVSQLDPWLQTICCTYLDNTA
jgi:hypothetical protein